MRLHLPLPILRYLLLMSSFIGAVQPVFGTTFHGYTAEDGNWFEDEYRNNDKLIFCHNQGSMRTESFDNNNYLFFRYNTSNLSGGVASYGLTISGSKNVVFSNNVSTCTYTYDITGVKAYAGGGAIGGDYSKITDVDELRFIDNRATNGVGGAIESDGHTVYIQECDKVIFKDNYAKIGGGAIGLYDHWKGWNGTHSNYLYLTDNGSVSFSSNRTDGNGGAVNAAFVNIAGQKDRVEFCNNSANQYGGAINAGYAYITDQKGIVEFSHNSAGNDGGAIRLTSYNGYNSDYWRTIYLHNNSNKVIFADNSTGGKGAAICTTSKYGTGYFTNNKEIVFVNNKGGAIYSVGDIRFQGNEHVLFKNNEIAIEAATIYLSTTSENDSSVVIYDSLLSKNIYFNSLSPVYNSVQGVANGSVYFIGKQSNSIIQNGASISSGTLQFKSGANMEIGNTLSVKGGTIHIIQAPESHTVLTLGGGLNFESEQGTLLFDLNYGGARVDPMVPMVKVNKKSTFRANSLQVDDSDIEGVTAFIPLLEANGGFTYGGSTYSYSNEIWKKNGVTVDINSVLPLTATADSRVSWIGDTLYYSHINTDGDTYKTKWLYHSDVKTWQNDNFCWYDTNKDRIKNSLMYGENEKDVSCWIAASANVIQYWQDRYAPLYQGDNLITNRNRDKQEANEIYCHMMDALSLRGDNPKLISDDPKRALEWWFCIDPPKGRNNPFLLPKVTDNWSAFGFCSENLPSRQLLGNTVDKFQDNVRDFFNLSETGLIFGIKLCSTSEIPGKDPILEVDENAKLYQSAGHAINVWTASFRKDEIGDDYCEVVYTDSDEAVGIPSLMTIRFDPIYGPYIDATAGIYKPREDGSRWYIDSIYTITTPDGMSDMLEEYNNSKTLYWTGTAIEEKWVANDTAYHLASQEDGWKKYCGENIYAHAAFCTEESKNLNFVFGNRVGDTGPVVSSRTVAIPSNIAVHNIEVNDCLYKFTGVGEIQAENISVNSGLALFEDVCINAAILKLNGVFCCYDDSKLQDCSIEIEDRSVLRVADIQLAPRENSTLTLGGKGFELVSSKIRLNDCSISVVSGTHPVMWCGLELKGKSFTLSASELSGNDALNSLLFAAITRQNSDIVLKYNDFIYKYEWIGADIVATTDELTTGGVNVAGGSLELSTGNEKEASFGSYGLVNLESKADICIHEGYGTTIQSSDTELYTLPGESIWLAGGTSILAPRITVSTDSCLVNDGILSCDSMHVENAATLYGSGKFGATIAENGSRVIVGDSPGAPVYQSLTLESGSALIFCIDGAVPATSASKGWGSGTHSVLHITGNDGLVVQDGASVQIGCSQNFLQNSPLGEIQKISAVQLCSPSQSELINTMQNSTTFYLSDEHDALSDITSAGVSIHHTQWKQGTKNTLELSFIVSTYPEDALIWTNDSGDGEWNSASLNWQKIDGEEAVFANDCNVAFYDGGTVELTQAIKPAIMVVSTPDNVTFGGDGQLFGSGLLVKEGSGTLIIDTSNPEFVGDIAVDGGCLIAARDGALGKSLIAMNNATLDLGDFSGPQAVYVRGKSKLQGISQLPFLYLADNSHASLSGGFNLCPGRRLVNEGNTTLNGSLTLSGGSLLFSSGGLKVSGGTSFTPGTTTIVDLSDWQGATSGTVTLAQFGLVNGYTEESLTLIGLEEEAWLIMNENSGVLTLSFSQTAPPSPEKTQQFNLNRNQRSVYKVMQSLRPSAKGELGNIVASITNSRSEEEVRALLDEVSGSEYATLMNSQMDGSMAHLRNLRNKMGYGWQLVGSQHLRAAIEMFQNQSEVENDAFGRGYSRNEEGGQLTLEFEGCVHMSSGVALAASRTELQPDKALRQEAQNTYADFYTTYRSSGHDNGGYSAKISIGIGSHEYDLKRRVFSSLAIAETEGTSVNFMHESAWTVQMVPQHCMQFYGVVESSWNYLKGFRENGAGAAFLNSCSAEAWATDITLGMRYVYEFSAFTSHSIFTVQGGVTASVGDISTDMELYFADAPGCRYTQSSAVRNRWGYNIGANLHLPINTTTAFYVGGEAILRGDSREWNANAGIQVAF